jgi:peroxin-5
MESAFRANSLGNHSWQTDMLNHPPQEITPLFHSMPGTALPLLNGMEPYHTTYSPFMGSLGLDHLPLEQLNKGKGKMVELDESLWEEQFRAFEDTMKDDEANKAIDKELDLHESEQFFGDFQSIWNGIRAEEAEKLAGGDMDFLDRFNEEMFDVNDVFDGKPDLGDYLFEPDNSYMSHPDAFSEGVRLMEAGGSLSEAALAFEAACQLQSTRVEAWTYLGTVQAQNEKELAAIRALEQAIRLDEANLSALMVCS